MKKLLKNIRLKINEGEVCFNKNHVICRDISVADYQSMVESLHCEKKREAEPQGVKIFRPIR